MATNVLDQLKLNMENIDLKAEIAKIFEHEKKHRGIDWKAFYDGHSHEDEKVKNLFSQLDINGDASLLRTNPNALLAANDEKVSANWHIANTKEDGKMIDYVVGLTGSPIKDYIVLATQKLQLAEQHTSAFLIGIEIAGAGVVAIGSTWAFYAIKALAKGGVTLAAACSAGVAGLGIGTVLNVIGVIIIIILIPFLIFMDKKAEMMVLILNRTNKNVDMEYYFSHGKLVAKPQELVSEGIMVSIAKNIIFDDGEVCAAGIMLVSKIDYALVGVEGACKINFRDGGHPSFPNGVHIGFSVPLAIGDNSCFISWDKFNDTKDFFNIKYDSFKLQSEEKESSRQIQARVNKGGGEEPAMIAVIKG